MGRQTISIRKAAGAVDVIVVSAAPTVPAPRFLTVSVAVPRPDSAAMMALRRAFDETVDEEVVVIRFCDFHPWKNRRGVFRLHGMHQLRAHQHDQLRLIPADGLVRK